MRTRQLSTCLLGLGIAIASLSCIPEPAIDDDTAPPASSSGDATVPGSPFQLVPPREASYDEMWNGLRELESLSLPLSSESAKQMLVTLRENGGSAPAGAVDPQPMIINLGSPGEESLWMVAYTDPGLLKPDTYAVSQPPRQGLETALYNEHVRGLSFNPYTKVSKEEVFNFNVNKLYIAGLIGYLGATHAAPGTRCQAANTAYRAGKPYETLHHALRALDEKEEWSECELAKLWAMWELDFPSSRKMAYDELEWFIGKGNDTPEAREMLQRFRNERL